MVIFQGYQGLGVEYILTRYTVNSLHLKVVFQYFNQNVEILSPCSFLSMPFCVVLHLCGSNTPSDNDVNFVFNYLLYFKEFEEKKSIVYHWDQQTVTAGQIQPATCFCKLYGNTAIPVNVLSLVFLALQCRIDQLQQRHLACKSLNSYSLADPFTEKVCQQLLVYFIYSHICHFCCS